MSSWLAQSKAIAVPNLWYVPVSSGIPGAVPPQGLVSRKEGQTCEYRARTLSAFTTRLYHPVLLRMRYKSLQNNSLLSCDFLTAREHMAES